MTQPVPVQMIFPGTVTINLGPTMADVVAAFNAAIAPTKEQIMTELASLQAADTAVDTAVEGLQAEQAAFLAHVAARLSAVSTDPAAIEAIAADLNARVADLQAATVAEQSADPGAPAEPTV